MSPTLRTPVALVGLAACTAFAARATHPAAHRFDDPTTMAGPAAAGCTVEARDPSGAVRAVTTFDEDGHEARVEERFVDGAPTLIRATVWAGDHDVFRSIHSRATPSAPLVAVSEITVTWEGGLPVAERSPQGLALTTRYDASGRRLSDEWAGEDPVRAEWTWTDLADGGVRATTTPSGWAPTTFTWDAQGRLRSREVGSSRTTYRWDGDAVVGWTSDGREVVRESKDGRVLAERTNGELSRSFTWQCPNLVFASAAGGRLDP